MSKQFNIADAEKNIEALNDYLVEVVEKVKDGSVHFAELESLMNNPQFSRLMQNVRFFIEDGNKHLAKVHYNLAKMYESKVPVV